MADSILRLKVESQEYDQKIKRAAEGIQQYAQKCREAGGTLEHLDDGVLEFVQALGQMDTVATGTKQQLREMSNALTTLTTTYRGLTDEEKASPLGQELAKGIQQLTERAGAAKDAMMDVEQSIKNAASDTRMFDQLSQGASVMTAGFQGLIGAGKLLGIEMGNDVEVIAKLQSAMAVTNSLTTIQTALQKQSALMQGVQAAQTAAAAAAQGSLASATGVATVAQKAFNLVANANPYVLLASAVLAVGSALWAFASASSEAKKKEEELAKAEEEAMKKADAQRQSFVDASSSAMNTASRLSSLQTAYQNANSEMEKTNILKQAQAEFKKLGIECKGVGDAQTLLIQKGSEVIELIKTQGTVAALSAIRMEKFKESFKMLLENGYSASAAASLAGYNKEVVELDGQITAMQSRIQNIKGSLGTGGSSTSGSNTKTDDTNYAVDSIMAQEKEVARLTDEWKRASAEMRDGILADLDAAKKKLQSLQNVGKPIDGGDLGEMTVTGSKLPSINNNFNTSALNFDSINTYISGVKEILKNADLGTPLYESMTEKLKDASTMSSLLQQAMDSGVKGADLAPIAEELKAKLIKVDITDEAWQEFIDKLNEMIENEDLKLVFDVDTKSVDTAAKEMAKLAAQTQKAWSLAAQSVSNIGTALAGIDDPEAKAAGTVIKAIADIAAGFAAASAQASSMGPWGWLAFLAAGTAAAATTISTVHSLTGYANGGIYDGPSGFVPGNSFSGDNVMANGGMVGLNSGELILNHAQQGNLASQLEGSGLGNMQLETRVDAEEIIIMLNNNGLRRGRGRYIDG